MNKYMVVGEIIKVLSQCTEQTAEETFDELYQENNVFYLWVESKIERSKQRYDEEGDPIDDHAENLREILSKIDDLHNYQRKKDEIVESTLNIYRKSDMAMQFSSWKKPSEMSLRPGQTLFGQVKNSCGIKLGMIGPGAKTFHVLNHLPSVEECVSLVVYSVEDVEKFLIPLAPIPV